jgi:glycosidase
VSRSGRAALAGALLLALPASAAVAPPRPPAGAELQALSKPPVRTSIASQRLYFVMVDRYANGDPSNDRGGLAGGRTVTGYDPTDIGWFHGGDLKGLTGGCTDARHGLARLKELGFTGIWITPPYGQKPVQGDSAAYHGYWIRDFTTVDPHLGTDQDFADFVSCAHRLGLKVFLDVVVNHTADVIIPTGGQTYSDAPYRDCSGRRFDPARYAGGRTFPCLKASNMPHPPLILAGDRSAKSPAWLNDGTKYHNRGDIEFSSCSETCLEQGDFFGLDDLFTEQPAVVNGLAAVYGSWIARYKVDGFRIDTARHVDRKFFGGWVAKIRAAARAAGVADFELFGEVFISNAIDLSAFVRERGLPNVLDFPFQEAAAGFAGGGASARGLAARLGDDDYFQGPSGVAHTPPTFLGNHDMGRAALKIREAGAPPAELLRRDLLGHDLLYLLRGAPVVYYGDEVGIIGSGGDKQARQDLFPTEVAQWRTDPRVGAPPIGTGSSFDSVDHPVGERLRALAMLRDRHPALSTGASIVRYAQRGVLAVSRIDAAARREYLAVFNAGTAAATVTLPTGTPSSSWTVLLGGIAASRSGADGRLRLAVPPLQSVLLEADAALPARAPARPGLRVGPDDLTDFWRVSATAGPGPVSVAFAVRRAAGKRWVRLAVDDSPPYRAFLDPRRYRRGESVYLVAVSRGLDGKTAISPVVPFTVRRR